MDTRLFELCSLQRPHMIGIRRLVSSTGSPTASRIAAATSEAWRPSLSAVAESRNALTLLKKAAIYSPMVDSWIFEGAQQPRVDCGVLAWRRMLAEAAVQTRQDLHAQDTDDLEPTPEPPQRFQSYDLCAPLRREPLELGDEDAREVRSGLLVQRRSRARARCTLISRAGCPLALSSSVRTLPSFPSRTAGRDHVTGWHCNIAGDPAPTLVCATGHFASVDSYSYILTRGSVPRNRVIIFARTRIDGICSPASPRMKHSRLDSL